MGIWPAVPAADRRELRNGLRFNKEALARIEKIGYTVQYKVTAIKKGPGMKNVNLLIWLTQLGISVAMPLAGFTLLGVWLHDHLGWGKWVILAGVLLGLSGAVGGLQSSLRVLSGMARDKKEDDPPPVAFNEHD